MAGIDMSGFEEDFDPETIDQSKLPKPGKCQLLVSTVEDKGDYVTVASEIVAHVDETQVGKTEYNLLNKSGKGAKRALLFGLALGLITKQQIADAYESGVEIDIPFEDAYSKTYLGTLAFSSYQGKDKCRVEWDFKHIDCPEAKDYPRNLEYADPIAEDVDEGTGEEKENKVEKPEPKASSVKDGAAKAKAAAAKAKATAGKKTTKTEDIPF